MRKIDLTAPRCPICATLLPTGEDCLLAPKESEDCWHWRCASCGAMGHCTVPPSDVGDPRTVTLAEEVARLREMAYTVRALLEEGQAFGVSDDYALRVAAVFATEVEPYQDV